MHSEKLYENCLNNPDWFVLMVFPILKTEKLRSSDTFYHTVPVSKTFCFAYISAWENDNISVCLDKDAPWKALQKLYEQIPIEKRKSLSNMCITVESNNIMLLFHSEYGKNDQND